MSLLHSRAVRHYSLEDRSPQRRLLAATCPMQTTSLAFPAAEPAQRALARSPDKTWSSSPVLRTQRPGSSASAPQSALQRTSVLLEPYRSILLLLPTHRASDIESRHEQLVWNTSAAEQSRCIRRARSSTAQNLPDM